MPLSLLVGSVARPFGHSGALHTGGAVSLMCGSVRRLGARPGPAALQSCFANFACNSLFAISKFEFMSLELQRFWALLKVHSIELHAKFGEGRVGGCGGVLVRDFFSLLGLLVARAVQSSPCWRQMPQNRRFSVCWESFVPGEPTGAACWGSFVPDVVSYAVQSSSCWRQMAQNRRFWVCWESFVPVRPARAANRESFVPGRRIRCAGPVS